MYTSASIPIPGEWVQVGMGIRLAMDVGAHRKRPSKEPSVEDGLWNRIFWYVIHIHFF